MGSLGAILRREREARGISLEEIAEQTKISLRMLRAIENEQFERLPGGLFNKSFVRQYARILGVDEEVAVREYWRASGARREASLAQRPRAPEAQNFSGEGDSSRLVGALIAGAVLVAGMAYGGYRLYSYLTAVPAAVENRGSLPAPQVALPTPAPAEPQPASVEPYEAPAARDRAEQSVSAPPSGSLIPQELSQAAPSVIPSPESADRNEPASTAVLLPELRLRIDSHGPVWLSVTADGVMQWQGTMRPNQSREVQATESVRLTVGDAGAASLTLNGKPLPSLGRPGEVRNLTITARDASQSAP